MSISNESIAGNMMPHSQLPKTLSSLDSDSRVRPGAGVESAAEPSLEPGNLFTKLSSGLRGRIYGNLELKCPAHIHLIAFQLLDSSRWVYLFEHFARIPTARSALPIIDLLEPGLDVKNDYPVLQIYSVLCLTAKLFLEEVRPILLGSMKCSSEIQSHRVFWRDKNYGYSFFESDLTSGQFSLSRFQMLPRIMDNLRSFTITIKPDEYPLAQDHDKNDWLEALTLAIEHSSHQVAVNGKQISVVSVWQGMEYETRGQGRSTLSEEKARMNDCVVSHMEGRVGVTVEISNDELQGEVSVWDPQMLDRIVSSISPVLDDDEQETLDDELMGLEDSEGENGTSQAFITSSSLADSTAEWNGGSHEEGKTLQG